MSDAATAPTPPSDRHRVREPWPDVTGRPGTTQGRYGVAGNLELVAPAIDDGLWVGWFNADRVETFQGAAVRRWSGALRFGGGRRYVSASISQVHAGPDFLEVLATSSVGDLHRLVWTPDDGFVDHGPVARGIRSASRLVETPDGEHLVAVADARGVRLLAGRPGGDYPHMGLDARGELPGPGVVDDRQVTDVDAAWHGGPAGDAGHLDVVTRAASGEVHLGCPAEAEAWIHVSDDATAVALAADGGSRAVAVAAGGRAWLHVVAAEGRGGTGRVDLGPAEAVAVAAGQVHGDGPWQVVIRNGAGLRHVSGGRSDAVVADGWAPRGTSSLHRG